LRAVSDSRFTLDAIHLAAIEFIRSQGGSLQLASYDERLVGAACLLGIAEKEYFCPWMMLQRGYDRSVISAFQKAAGIAFIGGNGANLF
jgi:hypothetical protein